MEATTQELIVGVAGGSLTLVLTGVGWVIRHLLTGKRRELEAKIKEEELAATLLGRVRESYELVIGNLNSLVAHLSRKLRRLEHSRSEDRHKILELTQHRDECETQLANATEKIEYLEGRLDTVEIQVQNGGTHGGVRSGG